MATVAGELVYKITGDSSGLRKEMDKTRSSVKETGGILSKIGPTIAAAFSIGALVSFGKALVKSASDAEETANKFGAVFKDIAVEAGQSAGAIAKAYGLSNQAAKELISTTGNVLQSFGMTTDESFNMSAEITKLSADLVSFTNYAGGVEGASRAITSALLGEKEALKGLGIAISETDLKQYAADQGKVWEQLDKSTQATMTYELITKRAKNALGDFANSANSFANTSRTLSASWDDFMASLGKGTLPVLSWLNKAFSSVLDNIAQQITEKTDPKILATRMRDTAAAQIAQAEKVLASGLGRAFAGAQAAQVKAGAELRLKEAEAILKKLEETQAKVEKKSSPVSGIIAPPPSGGSNKKSAADIAEEEAARITAAVNEAGAAAYEMWDKLNSGQKFQLVTSTTLEGLQGVSDALQALGQLQQALTERRVYDLEVERQAALEKANAEEDTAVEKAQKDYDLALQAADQAKIVETKKALDRAKINEKYDKQRRKLEYAAAVDAWEIDKSMALVSSSMAILNAIAAGAKFGPIGMAAYGALATGLSAVQIAAIDASKPQPPKFAQGGIVPGTSTEGDRVPVLANSGELILNRAQQDAIAGQLGGMVQVPKMTEETWYRMIFKASQDGQLYIDKRAVTA